MENSAFLKVYSDPDLYRTKHTLILPLESLITLSIYKFCASKNVKLIFVCVKNTTADHELKVILHDHEFNFIDPEQAPWQVTSCMYPVVQLDDLIITGLCAVARHICKYRTAASNPQEHEEGLLGFRHSCLQAPNETSIWTKFCEIDIVTTVKCLLVDTLIGVVPCNLLRFESHLNKPVKVHNVYKIARNVKKEEGSSKDDNVDLHVESQNSNTSRTSKSRKWKSNLKKELEIDSSTKIEDLNISHKFAEGPFFTLADILLYPNYDVIMKKIGKYNFQTFLPLTYNWYESITSLLELKPVITILKSLVLNPCMADDIIVPLVDDVSLYKSDPKRHNPKKRIYTKEDDIEDALSTLVDGMELSVTNNNYYQFDTINWDTVPDGANPIAGHLPDERKDRKTQQLENLTLAVTSIAKDGDLIVDFCSGSGHLGILIAHLLPKCTVILLENKEQSLLRARKRVQDMGQKNVFFFQCNLDFFIGKFDIGIALHACGIASDLVLDKCLKVNAKFVVCPCCYGSLHATDRLVYPRSCKFSLVPIEKYLCIGHAADQTHEDHPLTIRGARCMAVIDSDRARLAEEHGYEVTLSRLKPLSCTPKNNLLVGVPS